MLDRLQGLNNGPQGHNNGPCAGGRAGRFLQGRDPIELKRGFASPRASCLPPVCFLSPARPPPVLHMNSEDFMNPPSSPLLQRGVKLPVLDHGHVMLVDYMGSDTRIEEVARLSYNTGGLALGNEKGRSVNDTRGLLRYLLRHGHTSPFEQVCVTLDMKLPIFVARQLVRHRTQKLNEVSARYSVLPEEFYLPPLSQVCVQSEVNKQGRGQALDLEAGVMVRESIKQHSENGFRLYRELLERGVARETARMVLSVNTYTHWCTTWDAHNLLHMLRLRLDSHAQWEVREYARVVAEIVQAWLPLTWEAFTDYTLRSVKLSRGEWEVLVRNLDRDRVAQELLAAQEGSSGKLSLREKRELLALLSAPAQRSPEKAPE